METIKKEQKNNQKKKMEAPFLRIIRIDDCNVIATSAPIPTAPKGAFHAFRPF